ncbi:MAG: hypothetical protein HWQ38_00435 [Nostoc sp. NMS7]|uniref:hypothetical protein n=1 Tax=Nostoc sp. NMS7 TaxID=2815391 RepID=UPI0025F5BB22|nr:hypothetical protein [Nostoc sp. NMS7]MBN3945029.1 hypothetical protein [Nostoc sp. NMS7]
MTKANQNQVTPQAIKAVKGLNMNPQQTIPVIGSGNPPLRRFRQLCKFWQPILGAIAAIVSLLVALFRIL